MKIGVYLDEYRPEDGGGYTMQSELFRALCRIRKQSTHEFVVISVPDHRIAEESKAAGLALIADNRFSLFDQIGEFLARTRPNFRRRFYWRNSLERKARAEGVDFIWFLGPRPRQIDLPYLTIVLDLQHRKQPWFPEVSEYGEWNTRERLLSPFLRRAAGIIVGTQTGKREVAHFFQVPDERIHILPHPTPDYGQSLSASEEIAPDPTLQPGFLFYPAQFWAHKNHVNLLLALKHLADEGLKIPLVLTGSDFGNQPFVKERIAELDLGEQIKILGFVDQGQLKWLYKNALALSYLSYFGPENLPPLEAFALGCPVLASKVDGSEEQLGDAALLVDPKNPREIASAVRKLFVDKALRSKLIERGHDRAENWVSEDFVRGVFGILDEFEPIRRNWA
jgi:glycosyltransferase involved in cell wall biosynthesis